MSYSLSVENASKEKKDLIAEMGSSVQDVAVAAAEELRRHSWLTDGSLQMAHLVGANLAEAKLRGAYVVGADLSGADLTDAKVDPNQLTLAKSLENATMPDTTKYERQQTTEPETTQ